MNHIELFAGIGGFRQAMNLIQNDFGLNFDCLGFSEIDANAQKTYLANYPSAAHEYAMGNIVKFNENSGNTLQDWHIDLLTGGFPCQAFSMMGKQKGFEDERGQMFFQIHHILKRKIDDGDPIKFVVLENVKALKTHNKGETLKHIISMLQGLGYSTYYDILNASDFGQAQNRNRVIIFATMLKEPIEFSAENISKALYLADLSKVSITLQQSVLDVLDKSVDSKYYLSDKLKKTILSDGSGNFKSKSEINQLIARPLTATMHKMHRACQDNYYSDGFINADDPIKYLETFFTKEELQSQPIRKLTPEEAFALQGFPKEFATNARNHGVCNGALYKQAGNAVSVNMIYAVLYYLFIYLNLK